MDNETNAGRHYGDWIRHFRWVLGPAAALSLVLLVGNILLGAPPAVDLGTASMLMREGRVSELDLRDTVLTVTKTSGQQVRVEPLTAAEWQGLLREARQLTMPPRLTMSTLAASRFEHDLGFAASYALPLGAGIILVLVAIAAVTGRLRPRRAA